MSDIIMCGQVTWKNASQVQIYRISAQSKDMTYMCQTLTPVSKKIYSTGSDLFNNLPPTIVNSNHITNVFMPARKQYILFHSISAQEFITN